MDFERDGHAQIQHFAFKLLIEKRREFDLETHLLFLDYEKAFDNIQRQILFKHFEIQTYPRQTVEGNSGHLHTKQNIDKI